jgi:outer membrane immunogenic protein
MARLLACAGALTIAFSTSAFAADMPRPVTKAPAMVTAPMFNWSGFYVGLHAGYGWGDKTWSAGGIGSVDFEVDGFLGGGQIGVDYQTGPLVWRAEADISATNIDGNRSIAGGLLSVRTEVDWMATATLGLGVTTGPALFYVKGGAAWADEEHRGSLLGLTASAGETRSGWVVGAGLEYMLASNWSAKLEYNYLDFGEDRVSLGGLPVDIEQEIHVVKFGVNYRFATGGKAPVGKAPAAAPVVTKY